MNRLSLGAALVSGAALAALAAVPAPADGCGIAPRHGEYVSTSEETALIVWDASTKTEHFVRRANFTSESAYDFGFLVPTPTRPHLDLADDGLFDALSALTAAKVEYQTVIKEVYRDVDFGCAGADAAKTAGLAADRPASKAAPGKVDVLEQKKLGDYDYAVLAFRRGTADTPATGAAELTKWLTKHGYEASPAIQAWLERYVKDEWCITAFKIGAKPTADPDSPNNANGRFRRDLRAKPIRMSFKAERPFYPYREPLAPPDRPQSGSRLLRVFVSAPTRVAGTLGDGSKAWPGKTEWAKPIDVPQWDSFFRLAKLTDDVKEDGLKVSMPRPAENWWLTEFEDRSSPRPGTDEVYFSPSADTSAVERPAIVVTNTKTVYRTRWWQGVAYLGIPVALFFGGLIAWRLMRRT